LALKGIFVNLNLSVFYEVHFVHILRPHFLKLHLICRQHNESCFIHYSVPSLSTVHAATLLRTHGDIDIDGCFSDVSEGLAASIFSLVLRSLMQLGYTDSCAPPHLFCISWEIEAACFS